MNYTKRQPSNCPTPSKGRGSVSADTFLCKQNQILNSFLNHFVCFFHHHAHHIREIIIECLLAVRYPRCCPTPSNGRGSVSTDTFPCKQNQFPHSFLNHFVCFFHHHARYIREIKYKWLSWSSALPSLLPNVFYGRVASRKTKISATRRDMNKTTT